MLECRYRKPPIANLLRQGYAGQAAMAWHASRGASSSFVP